jgi:hypothetical protein
MVRVNPKPFFHRTLERVLSKYWVRLGTGKQLFAPSRPLVLMKAAEHIDFIG